MLGKSIWNEEECLSEFLYDMRYEEFAVYKDPCDCCDVIELVEDPVFTSVTGNIWGKVISKILGWKERDRPWKWQDKTRTWDKGKNDYISNW